jgi:sugar lactone lactonase YvrE
MTETTILVDGYCFLEAPRWRADGLYASDIRGEQVLRIGLDGKVEVLAELETPCGLGWLPDGRLLIVNMNARQVMRLEPDGSLSVHADFTGLAPYPLNDMVVDRQGRLFVGQWGYDVFAGIAPVAAPILTAGPDGTVADAGGEILLANGVLIGPDDKTLIMTEMAGRRLSAFDIGDDGSLSRQRTWADLDAKRPDGICMDAEGGIWIADFPAGNCHRVIEGGRVTDRIDLPGRLVAAPALGGPNGRTLFIATTTGRSDKDGARADRGARIEMIQVSVPGCERP